MEQERRKCVSLLQQDFGKFLYSKELVNSVFALNAFLTNSSQSKITFAFEANMTKAKQICRLLTVQIHPFVL